MTTGADGPGIAIEIGWDGRKVGPTRGHGVSLPYVGIIASHTTERDSAIEEAAPPLAEHELVAPETYRRGSHWTACRLIEAPDDWHTDVPGWRSSVVEEFMRAWSDGAHVIDQGVASLT
jgi:hypothetical protein